MFLSILKSVKYPRSFADDNQPYLRIKKGRKRPFEWRVTELSKSDIAHLLSRCDKTPWALWSKVALGKVLDFGSFGNSWQSYRNHGFVKATSVVSKFLSLDQKCSKLGSAHHSIPSSNPEQWLWEGSTCVFNLQEIQRENGQRSKQLLFLPSPYQGAENKQSLFFSNWYHTGKEMKAGNASHKYPNSFHPAFSAQHMAPQHPPPPLLSRAHLALPKLYTKYAGIQVLSKGCSKDSGTACRHPPPHHSTPG